MTCHLLAVRPGPESGLRTCQPPPAAAQDDFFLIRAPTGLQGRTITALGLDIGSVPFLQTLRMPSTVTPCWLLPKTRDLIKTQDLLFISSPHHSPSQTFLWCSFNEMTNNPSSLSFYGKKTKLILPTPNTAQGRHAVWGEATWC